MLSRGDLTLAVSRQLERPVAEVLELSAVDVHGSTGKATAGVSRLQGTARLASGAVLPWNLTVKTLRAPGPTDEDAHRPQHWTYWRREAVAYESALLPRHDQGLERVECFGVFADGQQGGVAVALRTVCTDTVWDLDRFAHAARLLGRWQAGWMGRPSAIEWLARDQLRQRIVRTDATGGLVEPEWSDRRVAAVIPEETRPSFGGHGAGGGRCSTGSHRSRRR